MIYKATCKGSTAKSCFTETGASGQRRSGVKGRSSRGRHIRLMCATTIRHHKELRQSKGCEDTIFLYFTVFL